ncbi:hypothetical protein J1P26_22085 [Neobacillus sp. MM2021_6]|uniref:DUF6731 family protein n=1 Tax=Bacillaceae TaxID=186817 RepID=UPI00140CFF5A|nr:MULTISPECIES: DUF6731 family protein [Bacillaceae]MBO0962395.1 hypothetical protein [Neobacillus sp. MM2021_6]NHC21036.1 hypothetical protein [Bacillus sp. MM2020_4]
MITKYVNFDYFHVTCRPKDSLPAVRDVPFDLRAIFSILENKELVERTVQYKQEQARMEHFSFMAHTQNLWDIYFTRLRDFNLPSKAKKNSKSVPVNLDDDEYIGENVSAIYDQSCNIIMIQRNRYSLGPSAIEEYFNQFCDPNEEINLRPIYVSDMQTRVKSADSVRKLRIKFSDVKNANENVTGDSLKKWLNIFDDYDTIAGEILLTVGRKRKATLGGNLKGLVDEIYENQDLVSHAQASIKKTELADNEVIDLFNDNAHDIATFQVPPRAVLNHEAVILEMEKLYNARRVQLLRLIGR